MPGQVERWLETFMCKQYAEIFDAYGFKTLHLACQLQISQLQSMGISPEHCDMIYQQVQILRQTMNGPMQQQPPQAAGQQYGDEIHGHYGNRGQQQRITQGYQNSRDTPGQQMVGMNMGYNSSHMGSGTGNYGNQRSTMMSQHYGGSNHGMYPHPSQQSEQPHMNPAFRQQYPGTNYPQQSNQRAAPITTAQNSGYPSSHNQPGHYTSNQVQGAACLEQSNMQQSHPHLRTLNQTPQEVANNILHIASSSYPSNHTVQVPLSKNRSAPYHVPPRSPLYSMQPQSDNQQHQQHLHQHQQLQQQQHMGSMMNQGQFVYPNSSPMYRQQQQQQQQQQQHSRTSPISPASGVMQSPHSHHSGHSISSTSPGSINSPGMGGITSPASVHTPPSVHSQGQYQMNSPIRGQYNMCSPTSNPHQRMVSPVPVNQQLQVSVPSSHNAPQSSYRDNITAISPAATQSHSNFPSNSYTSPGGQSGHFSNISSPYTPGSKGSITSPGQTYNQTPTSNTYINTDIGQSVNNSVPAGQSGNNSVVNPLRSLQKLCMLPERQVVDPKSVVNDACAPSPQNNEYPKNCNTNADSQHSYFGNDGRFSESASSGKGEKIENHENKQDNINAPIEKENACWHTENINKKSIINEDEKEKLINKQNKHIIDNTDAQLEDQFNQNETNVTESDQNAGKKNQLKDLNQQKYTDHEEIKCQPKKMMLLRAAKDNFNDSDTCANSETELTADNNVEGKEVIDSGHVIVETEKDSEVLTNNAEDIEESLPQPSHECSSQIQQDITDYPACKSETESKIDPDPVPVSVLGEYNNMTDISESDDEPQLLVRKDVKKTYSKTDRLNSIDISARVRNDSTGSLSDGVVNSDIEYEDHIGCDDIENDLSYCDDKDDVESIKDRKDSDNIVIEVSNPLISDMMVSDKVLISSPHWKKSKLNNLQTVKGCPKGKGENRTSKRVVNGVKLRRKGVKRKGVKVIKVVNEMLDSNGDDMIPSPLGEDMVDGGMDNGDGTVSVTRSSRAHHRQRKTPLKYKDTSFFQGDFVFVDEEEDYFEPSDQSSVKVNGIDVNHNTRKMDELKKSKVTSAKLDETFNGCGKKELLKEKKQKQNFNTKSKQRKKKSLQEKGSETVSVVDNKQDDVVATKSIVEEKNPCQNEKSDPLKKKFVKNNKTVDSSHETDCEHALTNGAKNETSKKTKTPAKAKPQIRPKSEPAISTKNTSKSHVKSNANVDSTKIVKSAEKPLNGLKRTRRTRTPLKLSGKTAKEKNGNDQIDSDVEKDIDVKPTDIDDAYCIEINESDSNEIAPIKEEIKQEVFVKTEKTCVDLTCDETDLNNVDNTDIVKHEIKEEIKLEVKTEPSLFKKKTVSRRNRPAEKRVVKRKIIAKGKSASRSKRKLIDPDSDFEVGPKKKSLKMNRAQEILNRKKKKRDKWANFKGPMVRLEGSKEVPEKCIVINEPIDTTGNNKAKLTAHNVSTIHISQLPADKSVLVPHGEAEESVKWECALCGKHSSYKFLGDLFGPYSVESLSEDTDNSLMSFPKSKKRRSEESQASTSKSSRTSKRVGSVTKDTGLWREVWVHESCGVWSDGVFLIGTKIYGLQEAVTIATRTPCSRCHEMGAMIGCLNKGCQQKFHFSCALDSDCYLDEENFSLLCPKHKIKKLKQLESAACSSTGIS